MFDACLNVFLQYVPPTVFVHHIVSLNLFFQNLCSFFVNLIQASPVLFKGSLVADHGSLNSSLSQRKQGRPRANGALAPEKFFISPFGSSQMNR